jgi:HEPN domain-containing protein
MSESKSWLRFAREDIRMADLLSLLPKDLLGEMADRLLLMDQFYIPTRYPDALPGSLADGLPDKNDALETLKTAQELLKIIEDKLTQ